MFIKHLLSAGPTLVFQDSLIKHLGTEKDADIILELAQSRPSSFELVFSLVASRGRHCDQFCWESPGGDKQSWSKRQSSGAQGQVEPRGLTWKLHFVGQR